MNTEQIKKTTRVFFYGLAIAASVTVLAMIALFFTANWEDMWPIVIILTFGAATAGLIKLADWAFTPNRPAYRDNSTTTHYYNGSFIGDFPNYPYTGQRVNGYVWTHDSVLNSLYWKKDAE